MPFRDRPYRAAAVAAVGLSLLAPLASGSGAETGDDEPRGLARLFRFGNRGSSSQPADPRARIGQPRPEENDTGAPDLSRRSAGGPARTGRTTPADPFIPPEAAPGTLQGSPYGAGAANPYGGTGTLVPPGDPQAPASGNTRLVPQPRINRAVTEAPPLLTRIQLGRSDDGNVFGMFLQIYADGTVIDTEGVHKVGSDVMRPLVETLRAADVGRIKGHCGGPPVDFIQQVLITVYDQNRGRLQANTFSYSGNPSGCDPNIQRVQAAIDAVQMKLSPTRPPAAPATAAPTPAPTTPETPAASGLPPFEPPAADDAPPPLNIPGPGPEVPSLEITPGI